MESVHALFSTYLFLIPFMVMFLSEFAKFIIASITFRDIAFDYLFHPGGFPSTHSAFVTSLLIVVWYQMGPESIEFAIVVVFAFMTWYDAISSRRAIGEQAEILNRLQRWEHFQTRLGHSLTEVLGGIVYGGLVTIIGIWLST